jgi:protein O-mannosyl-transferase
MALAGGAKGFPVFMPAVRSKSRTKISKPIIAMQFGRWNILSCVLLVIAIAIAYIPLFSNSFIDYDDPAYITGNPHVRAGFTLETWKWAWTSIEGGNWHPLTWISHTLDAVLFGIEPAGHHAISLAIHILNAILLYFLLWKCTRKNGCSLLVATLYGLHPLAVESVSWAAERKNVLCTFFFFLSLAAYGTYVCQPDWRRYLRLMIAFALGLCAKPMVITLPFVLLLLDFWPMGRVLGFLPPNPVLRPRQFSFRWLVLEKLPLLPLVAASAVITIIAQSASGAIASTDAVPLPARVANAIYSYCAYFVKMVWPMGLAPIYPTVPRSSMQVGLALLFLIAISVAVWLQRAKRPYLVIGWLFYLGTLVPVIGLIQVGTQAMADRYTYIPIIGVLVMLVWLFDDRAIAHRWAPVARLTAAGSLLLVLAGFTWQQVRYWRDSVTLWSYNLEITKNNPVAEDNLGIALLQEGNTAEAMPHFYNAARLNPDDAISAVNIATDLLSRGQTQEAIARYEAALPNAVHIPMLLPTIHSNLGFAYLSLGNLERARDHYRLALNLNPKDQNARAGLRKIERSSAVPSN